MVTIRRVESHFRRSRNGAWLGNGETAEVFEVPDDRVAAYLSPGRCGRVTATWPDGVSVSVDGANDPIRGCGWGPFGYIASDNPHAYQGREGAQLHPRLPGYALLYHGVRQITPEQIASFKRHVIGAPALPGAGVAVAECGPRLTGG